MFSFHKVKGVFQAAARFFRRETVLCAAGLAALVTAFFVPPSLDYVSYLDFRVLALLFCLMAVVAGLGRAGVFEALSGRLAAGVRGSRSLVLLLVLLCFFSSMVITNDVALLTFVPFAVLTLTAAGQQKRLIFTVVLQTVAANLGSMLTPVGNPQNLYLYSRYGFTAGAFFRLTLPVTGASLLLVLLCCLIPKNEAVAGAESPLLRGGRIEKRGLFLHLSLFLLCLLTVFRVLPWQALLGVVFLAVLLLDRAVFWKVDYKLLLTFIFFFLFVGNIGAMDSVRAVIAPLIQGREMLAALLGSQVISNVPAAVLLSAFTDDGAALLLGTNIGGLGTLVASLASLISYRIYCGTQGARPGKYLLVFTIFNLLGLLPLCGLGLFLLRS